MDFGDAIRALKDLKRVARAGWNGKGMFLFLTEENVAVYVMGKVEDLTPFPVVTSICMKTAQNTIVVGWLASQTDMLAEDWEVVDGQ